MEETVWKIYQSIKTGSRHEAEHLVSQDRVSSEVAEGKIAICLLDGTGNEDVIAISNERIAKKMCCYAIEHFEDIFYQVDLMEMKYKLVREIYRVINEISIQYHISTQELASTCLIVAVDQETNRYCSLHLGDGIICFKSKGEIYPVSQPVNGAKANQTWLTISPYVLEHIRVGQGSVNEVEDIILASDGVYSEADDMIGEVNEVYESIRQTGRYPRQKMDDQGLIALSRK